MTASIGKIKVGKMISDSLTLEISLQGIKTFRIRLWIGKKILKLAAKVIGCGIKINPNLTDSTSEPS